MRKSPASGRYPQILAAVAAATLLLTAGCGINANKDATDDAGSPHNEADITFSQMMIPHHQQAIEMANLAETRAESQEVKDLAVAIEAAQDPEIQTMQGWLKSWDAEGMSHDMSEDEMPGMVDDKTMGDLGKASGAEFDQLFLTAMIAHHEGAIAMAESEKSDGVHKGSLSLADAVIKTQTAEIKRMRALLN
jgi:uncharacterized protein (DUF305 family)